MKWIIAIGIFLSILPMSKSDNFGYDNTDKSDSKFGYNNIDKVCTVCGTSQNSTNITWEQIAANIGNWSDDKPDYQRLLQNSSNITCTGNVCSVNLTISSGGGGADSLGNHTASQNLNMSGNSILGVHIIRAINTSSSNDFISIGTNNSKYVNNLGNDGYDDFYVSGSFEVGKTTSFSSSFYSVSPVLRDCPAYGGESGGGVELGVASSGCDTAVYLGAKIWYSYTWLHTTIGLDATNSKNTLMIIPYNYYFKYYAEASSNDPKVILYSSTDPNVNRTQWLSLTHNKTMGVISTGSGSLTLAPNNGIVYIIGNSTADAHIDYTPAYDKSPQEALIEVTSTKNQIKDGKVEINHSSLPKLAQASVPIKIRENCIKLCMDCSKDNCSTPSYHLPYKEEYANQSIKTNEDGSQEGILCEEFCDERIEQKEGRNLGGMITVLTESIKALDAKNKELEARLRYIEDIYG